MYFLYSLAFALALVLASPWYLAAAKRRAGLREKLGGVPSRIPPTSASERCIWIHAVSVGEVLAVSGLVKALRQEIGWRVVVSSTTVTGQKLARERLGEDSVFYFPIDLPFAMRPYFRVFKPELVVLVESEFWPNLLRMATNWGARVAVVNARVSDRSLPRYLRLRVLWKRILGNVDLFLARSQEDADRLLKIGVGAQRLRVAGNLKFDITAAPDLPIVRELRERSRLCDAVLVCGSTAEGEEAIILEAFQSVLARHAGVLLILAPRHPHRFDAVAQLVTAAGFKLYRRSQLPPQVPLADGVLLLDSIGELAATYALASVAFIGGSLVQRGGHNILEAAQHGVPILIGPHTENFRDIVTVFVRHQALHVVDRASLGPELLRLLENSAERQLLGRRAAAAFLAEAGATARTLDALRSLLVSTPAASKLPVEVAR